MYLYWLMFFLASTETRNFSDWMYPDIECDTATYEETYMKMLAFALQENTVTYKRPSHGDSPTSVYVGMYVTSIIEVNEKAQSFSTQVKMITVWSNEISLWRFDGYCGITRIQASRDLFWTPDLLIKESIKTEFGTRESPYMLLDVWQMSVTVDILVLTTACRMDLYRFPFDTQICNISFHSAVLTIKELTIDPLSPSTYITEGSKGLFQAQGEWELVVIDTFKTNATFIDDLQSLLVYQITIKRRPLLYVINIMLPVFFFLVMDLTSFFIDASGADKLSFKVTLLLAISVLLLILNDTLPSTADKLPLIGIYCSVVFSLIGISILETILVNFMNAKGAVSRSAASMDTTAGVTVQDDGVRDLEIPTDSVKNLNEIQISLCWIRVARITDTTFLIVYLITIIVFLSVLGKVWIS